MALSVFSAVFVLVSTALFAFRDRWSRIPWREAAAILLIALLTAGSLLFIEEMSHVPKPTETAEPSVPDAAMDDGGESNQSAAIRWAPGLALWLIAIAAVAVFSSAMRGARRQLCLTTILRKIKAEMAGFWSISVSVSLKSISSF